MIRSCLIALCLAAVTTGTRADTYRGYQSNTEDKIYAFEISEQHIARTPKWRADGAEPPLSPGKAVRLAESILPRLVASPRAWRSGRVHLQRINGSNNWLYMVDLIGPPYRNRGKFDSAAPEISVPVLLDGTVTLPRITPNR